MDLFGSDVKEKLEVHNSNQSEHHQDLPLKDIFDDRSANGLLTQRYAGLSTEQRRGDVVHGWRGYELLQRREITQEEPLEHIPVDSRQHRPVVGFCCHGQHALHMPQRLKQVEHVLPVLVEELAHERGTRPRGGQQQYVLTAAAVAGHVQIIGVSFFLVLGKNRVVPG